MPKRPRSDADRKYYRAYYLKNRERILAALKEKYQTDPEFRNRVKQKYRERYHDDAAYHKATLERARLRAREKKLEQEQMRLDKRATGTHAPGEKRTRKPGPTSDSQAAPRQFA
jgi:hypothetical protein